MPRWLIVAEQEGGGWLQYLPLALLYFFIFWLFLFKPQRRAEAKRKAELEGLQKNDTVLTQGGIIGVVVQVKEDEVVLRIDDKTNARIRIKKSAVLGKYEAKPDSSTPEAGAAS